MVYGIQVWRNSPEAARIFMLKKSHLEHCRLSFRAYCWQLFQELNIWTLPALFILESAIVLRRKPEFVTTKNEVHSRTAHETLETYMFPKCSCGETAPKDQGRVAIKNIHALRQN